MVITNHLTTTNHLMEVFMNTLTIVKVKQDGDEFVDKHGVSWYIVGCVDRNGDFSEVMISDGENVGFLPHSGNGDELYICSNPEKEFDKSDDKWEQSFIDLTKEFIESM
jgi:hypothetical protein